MCMSVFLHHVSESIICVPLWIPGTGSMDGCEPTHGCWEPKTGAVQE